MDRGWHHAASSVPERLRLGQQPYDRGRGISNDRRSCYQCGHDGHIKKFCPMLDARLDSGRNLDRAKGGGNGRYGHDSWPSSRNASTVGKGHGYWRTDGTKEGGNSRRPNFDCSESGEYTVQRHREALDRYGDNRSHGSVAPSHASVRDRDGKSSTRSNSSRRQASESHQSTGGHRGEDRRENRLQETEPNIEKSTANGDVSGSSHHHAPREDARNRKVNHARPAKKSSGSEVEMGPSHNTAGEGRGRRCASAGEHAAQQVAGSESRKETASLTSERDKCSRYENGVDRERKFDHTPTRLISNVKLPLSVLCKDAEEGILERQYSRGKGGADSEGPTPVEASLRPSPGEILPEGRAEGLQKDVELNCTFQNDAKLDCVSPRPEDETNIKGADGLVVISTEEKHSLESERKKEKDTGEVNAVLEPLKEPVVPGTSASDQNEGKGRLVLRLEGEKEEARPRDSAEDENVLAKPDESNHGSGEEIVSVNSSGAGKTATEMTVPGNGFTESGRHSPAAREVTSHLEREKRLRSSEDRASDHQERQGTPTNDEQEWHRYRRGAEPDCNLGGRRADSVDGESERDLHGDGVGGVGDKDAGRLRPDDNGSSHFGTSMKGRTYGSDRDNSHHFYARWGGTEESGDRLADRGGHGRFGRTGAKLGYSRHERAGSHENIGGKNGFVNYSNFRYGDDDREYRGCGLHREYAKVWEACQYRLASYRRICNARYLELAARSPPPRCQANVPVSQYTPLSHIERLDKHDDMESQGKDWTNEDIQDSQRDVQGLTRSKESQESQEQQPDNPVQPEGSNDVVMPSHPPSPLTSLVAPILLDCKQHSAGNSPSSQEASVPPKVQASPLDEKPSLEHNHLDNLDRDICPPGTETCRAADDVIDYDEFHIDERVAKLMEGRPLIIGRELDIVREALSIASLRVRLEFESNVAVEESPRSHGGFADMGDQWKDGDFGSDILGLEGFGFEPQVGKADMKPEEVAPGTEGEAVEAGVGVSSAPDPVSRPSGVVPHHAETKRELWKWPSRGGDWKVVYMHDHNRGETHGSAEKGPTGHPRKVVMNGGQPLCDVRNAYLRDPRRQHQNAREVSSLLQLPPFALKIHFTKVDSSGEDNHGVTFSKGPNSTTPKSQGSTPRGHLLMPAKDRSFGSATAAKVTKTAKSGLTPSSGNGLGSKSALLVKQQPSLPRGSKIGNLATKLSSPGPGKNSSGPDKRGLLRLAASPVEEKLRSNGIVEAYDKKSRATILVGSIESPSSLSSKAVSEAGKDATATPLKKLFLSRSCLRDEDTISSDGNHGVNAPPNPVCSASTQDALPTSPQTKEKDRRPASPPLGVLTPLGLRNILPDLLQTSGFAKSQEGEKQLHDQSVMQMTGVVPGTSFDDSPRMMEIEEFGVRSSISEDLPADQESCRQKRKSSSVDNGVAPKWHQKNSQRRRLLEEAFYSDRNAAHSSLGFDSSRQTMPQFVDDDNLARTPDTFKEMDQGVDRVEDQDWASLNPNILHTVFRSLRGDVKTLVNAMAACKSWLAAGKKCKTELKRADLSSVQGHSLDAVLESLPEFGGGKLRRIVLKGCSVSPESLGHLLKACPSISAVEIGCNEALKEVICSFPQVRWVGDQNGVQVPRKGLPRKRQGSHLKSRGSKMLNLRESSSRDGAESDVHPVSDSASKARSPDGYTSVISTAEVTVMNESIQDSTMPHVAHGPEDGVKHLRLSIGETVIKSIGINGSMKSVKRVNGNSVSRLQRRKMLPARSPREKFEEASSKLSKPVMGGQRILADKYSSTSGKVEHYSKSTSLLESDKTLEKDIGAVLRRMMDADTNKCFQAGNFVAAEGKGASLVAAKQPLDLLKIEKKLKSGSYTGGKDGFKAFKEDVLILFRAAFRKKEDKITYSTAESLFRLAHKEFASIENQIAGILPGDADGHGKSSGPRPYSKANMSRVKSNSMLQTRPGKKRKAWDYDGVLKRKSGSVKKGGGQVETSSGDVDSGSDTAEHEAQRSYKSKKERCWESEGESSEDDEEPTFMEEDEETETEASDSDVVSESEGEDGKFAKDNCDTDEEQHVQLGYRDWGARMTKAAMVPPVTRKYVVIEEYRIVTDKEHVEEKMKVQLPEDYEEKALATKEKRADCYSHLDIPDLRDCKPRKKLGEEVLEQEVYGIDPYTHNLLWDTMPVDMDGFPDGQKQQFIEERLLLALNREAKQYTGSGKAPMEYNLERVVERVSIEAGGDKEWALRDFCDQLLANMRNRPKDKFVAYRKGLGVVCNKTNGLEKDEFVVEFFGEVYAPWRWYEKQDGIRSLQKKDKDTTPEFYNIFYERPKGDAAGYDLLVVDAMHQANFASRLCHSCRPNCEAKITAVNSKYIIGVYTLKPIKRGEELTFDYNSVTESMEEYNNAVCLCGSQGCRGSYLNLTGSGTFEEVILKHHGLLDRHRLLLDSCSSTPVLDDELNEMRQAGLGSCLLSGQPSWVLKYAARLVRFMNFEKTHLPAELLREVEQMKLKNGALDGCPEVDPEITTEGVYNQRLQNLAITLDKVRHILTKIYKRPSEAPPPLRMLDRSEVVQWVWKREGSVVQELLHCLDQHLDGETSDNLKLDVSRHSPSDGGHDLQHCLFWLRDKLRQLPATCRARHDIAADLIHIYAHTRTFFTVEDYEVVESPPLEIHPLDLGSSRHQISVPRQWHKTYAKDYVWGQLIGWYKQSVPDPGAGLAKAARGCLNLPDISSCYAKSRQHDFRLGYGRKLREKMICHMEEKGQHKWPNSKHWSQFWCYKNERCLFGSPMLDAILENKPLDVTMSNWLRTRSDVFVGPWDEQ